MRRLFSLLADGFPLWVLGFGLAAMVWPEAFRWFSGAWVTGALAVVMLAMGLTLRLEDFAPALAKPRAVGIGFVVQYGIMPLLSWAVARLLALPPDLAVGLILVGCAPGGTASNLVAYLARADVPLSVLMTTASTLAAAVMTPLMAQIFAGTYVAVDGWGLMISTLCVVVLPVLAGTLLQRYASQQVRQVEPAAPLVAVLAVAMIVGSVVAGSRDALLHYGFQVAAGVMLLHGGGFALGYLVARLLGLPIQVNRTISIEVGMQNSGLAVMLAQRHFAAMPLATVPGAVSAAVQCVMGSLLGAWWRLAPRLEPLAREDLPADHVDRAA